MRIFFLIALTVGLISFLLLMVSVLVSSESDKFEKIMSVVLAVAALVLVTPMAFILYV